MQNQGMLNRVQQLQWKEKVKEEDNVKMEEQD
jgi:hypothetical protein